MKVSNSQKSFTPPHHGHGSGHNMQQSHSNGQKLSVMRREKNEEFYCGTKCDTFLPSVNDLPLPPREWIESSKSKSTPTSPIIPNKPLISATKSIDISTIFGTPPTGNKGYNNGSNKNASYVKSASYPGEKRFDERKNGNNKPRNNNNNFNKRFPKDQQQQQKQKQQHPKEMKTASTPKTNSTTVLAAPPTPVVNSPKPASPEKEISSKDLMAMLGVVTTTIVNSPPKKVEERKVNTTPIRYGSPQRYQDITNNLKHLLKVQA